MFIGERKYCAFAVTNRIFQLGVFNARAINKELIFGFYCRRGRGRAGRVVGGVGGVGDGGRSRVLQLHLTFFFPWTEVLGRLKKSGCIFFDVGSNRRFF